MPYCTARGMRFHYVEAGEGPPVLLLHPAPLDLGVWTYQLCPLSQDFRVIAVDQRCFGRSEKSQQPFGLAEVGTDVEAVLDTLQIPSAHIVGMSIGGIAAQLVALRRPSLIRKLVLVGTTAVTSTAAFVKERLRRFQSEEFLPCYASIAATLFSASFRETPIGRYLLGTFVERARQLDRTAMLRFYEALQDFDIRDQIAQITHETLVVAGSEDVTFALSQDVASRIRQARFVPIHGYGRAVSLEAPEVLTRTVREFLLDGGQEARR